MSKSELFDILKEQLFDRLVSFDQLRKTFHSSLVGDKNELAKLVPNFAKNSAKTLAQIATASRLERYEYQEALTDNIKSLRNNPEALKLLTKSRDQSIMLEFMARTLSMLYYEVALEGIFGAAKDKTVVNEYAEQSQELSTLILFSLGKELLFDDEELLEIMTNIGKVHFCSSLYERIQTFGHKSNKKLKESLIERQIQNLRYRGTLYKDHFTHILSNASGDFWWEDHILRYFLYAKAEHYFSAARDILSENPLDPSLLLTIDYEIALCKGQAQLALGGYYLELAVNVLLKGTHQQSYEHFMTANKYFNKSKDFLKQLPVESSQTQEVIDIANTNIEFTKIFSTLLGISTAIIELSNEEFGKKALQARIESLSSLVEAPLENVAFYNQSEFLNTVGFILENITVLLKYDSLTKEQLKKEMKKGFNRLGLIFKGRIDNSTRVFLQLPWQDDQKELEVKRAFCETESQKLQDITISILLMPEFVSVRKELVAKCRTLLSLAISQLNRLKGLKETNATKALCLLVKSHLDSKESYENLKKGEVMEELEDFVIDEYSRTFIQSHLKEAAILQNGNQYFFARYLLRTLPDMLATTDFSHVPREIAKLLIDSHGAMFDSMITIWSRLTAHYETIYNHRKENPNASEDIVNWDYIEKKRDHTKGAMLFFQSCQAIIQAQEYAIIKERIKAEKLFRTADKCASEAAAIFNSVINTLKGEVQQLPKDLFNFANFCKVQGQKVAQGKKIDDLPVKDFVVLIGIISSSL
jgi:hypothetical protein